MEKKEIREAKRKLFTLLLNFPDNLLSGNEIDIMHYLSLDEDIQEELGND